jgi:putative transposase
VPASVRAPTASEAGCRISRQCGLSRRFKASVYPQKCYATVPAVISKFEWGMTVLESAPPVRIQRAVQFTLDPTPVQVRALHSHAGAARFTYNFLLAAVSANWSQRQAEKSYGIPEGDLTPAIPWNAYGLASYWNTIRHTAAPWWNDNGSRAYRTGARQLGAALANYRASKTNTRAGQAMRFPKFKNRSRAKLSVNFEDSARLDPSGHGVFLPRIGRIHTFESALSLIRQRAAGTAKINSTTVSFQRGRWVAAVQYEVESRYMRPRVKPSRPQTVGIDMGVKDQIVIATPDGIEVGRIPAPQHLAQALATLRTLQKRADRQIGPVDPTTKTPRTPSAGWHATQARIRKVHARVANLRQDFLHKTTTRLTQRYEVIVTETLAVKNMIRKSAPKPDPDNPGAFLRNGRARKRGLSRSLTDASLGTVLRMIAYKCSWYGATHTKAPRFYPSSKTCSGCGSVKATLPLSERVYTCSSCGLAIDRDLNAAINLARLSTTSTASSISTTASSGAGSALVTGRDTHRPAAILLCAGHVSVKPEPH